MPNSPPFILQVCTRKSGGLGTRFSRSFKSSRLAVAAFFVVVRLLSERCDLRSLWPIRTGGYHVNLNTFIDGIPGCCRACRRKSQDPYPLAAYASGSEERRQDLGKCATRRLRAH